MKVISIKQPWAWLIVNGYKNIENRTWSTRHRGELYIHASKKADLNAYDFISDNFQQIRIPKQDELEFGGIVGKTNLIDVVKKSDSKWFFGPNGFMLQDPEKIDFIPLRGNLMIFDVDDIMIR